MTVYTHEARWPQALIAEAAPAPVSTRWAHNLTGMNEKPADDIEKLTSMVRRTLVRLAAIEQRLATAEKRLHYLDDLPETVQGLERLAKRTEVPDHRIMEVAARAMDSRLEKLDARIDSRLDRRLGRIERTGRLPGG